MPKVFSFSARKSDNLWWLYATCYVLIHSILAYSLEIFCCTKTLRGVKESRGYCAV